MNNKYLIGQYKMSDIKSVYTHYNPKTGKNEPTENKINKGVNINGKSSKRI